MKIDGTVASVQPKAKGDGRMIEIKIITDFQQETWDQLGLLWNSAVTADIKSQQLTLGQDGKGQ